MYQAAGLATMIATMRPDIDHIDEYVRNTTARAFSVVASALGIPALLPFLRAVCKSKKSWQARHTGIKIIQQISILLGCGVLPHLKLLVDCIAHGLSLCVSSYFSVFTFVHFFLHSLHPPNCIPFLSIVTATATCTTAHLLADEQQKVRTITALALAGLAEASHPYGIECFESILKPLWQGIKQHRGKGFALL